MEKSFENQVVIEAAWQLRSRKDILPQETTCVWDKRLVEDEVACVC